jgi:hypothetical protein
MDERSSFTFRRLYPRGNYPQYPLKIRLKGPRTVLKAKKWKGKTIPCQEQNPVSAARRYNDPFTTLCNINIYFAGK